MFSNVIKDIIYKIHFLEDSAYLKEKYKKYIDIYLKEKYEKYINTYLKASEDVKEPDSQLGNILKDSVFRKIRISYREFIARIFNIIDTAASEALYKYDDKSLALYLFITQKINDYIYFSDYKDYLKDIHIKNEELKLIYGDMVIDDNLLQEIARKESEDNYNISYLWIDFQLTKSKTIKEFLDKNGYLKIKEVNELKDILDNLIRSK